uniref:CEP152 CEP63 binding coiled coil domain-containing protein n=1 Tax=Hucho hucho TaxID=62062 RepID=A0A4W5QKG3_9TELE
NPRSALLYSKTLGECLSDCLLLQVEGAVSRAYSRWLQDLPSLPEYKAALQREREKWEKVQEQHVQQQVSLALREAEERLRSSEEEQGGAGGDQRVEELQEEVHRWRQLEEDLKTEVEEVAHLQSQVDDLQSQLDREREVKAALLKAELLAARASWNREKQQEISSLQAYQEEQLKRAQKDVRKEANGEAERQRKELLLQKEAELQQALRDREEDWKRQEDRRGKEERRQGREEERDVVLQELKAGLKEVQSVLLRGGAHKENGGEVEGRRRASGSVRELLMVTCNDLLLKAVAQAKKEWKKISEERLGRVLKETQERHEKELNQIHSSTAQKTEEGGCGKQCAETVSELQKKSRDLQRHLEKACRQLQVTVKDHKASMQCLKDEHEVALRKEKEDNLQKLEELKSSAAKESSGGSDMEQSLHAGLEEMREQYMKAVEKIRGDMLRYLKESKERAAEMIRVEVLRERQDTARKMRRYYLTCLQELLEDGGQATGYAAYTCQISTGAQGVIWD